MDENPYRPPEGDDKKTPEIVEDAVTPQGSITGCLWLALIFAIPVGLILAAVWHWIWDAIVLDHRH